MGDTEYIFQRLRQVAIDGMMVLGLVILLAVELPH